MYSIEGEKLTNKNGKWLFWLAVLATLAAGAYVSRVVMSARAANAAAHRVLVVQLTADGEPVYCWHAKDFIFYDYYSWLELEEEETVRIRDVGIISTPVVDGDWEAAYDRLGVNQAYCEEDREDDW